MSCPSQRTCLMGTCAAFSGTEQDFKVHNQCLSTWSNWLPLNQYSMVFNDVFLWDALQCEEVLVSLHSVVLLFLLSNLTLCLLSQKWIGFL